MFIFRSGLHINLDLIFHSFDSFDAAFYHPLNQSHCLEGQNLKVNSQNHFSLLLFQRSLIYLSKDSAVAKETKLFIWN